MNQKVKTEVHGEIGLIGLANPPVNAFSHAVRVNVNAALDILNANPAVKVIAFYGEGSIFSAGADIREFGEPRLEPTLPTLCDQIEANAKPIIAVLHGSIRGGATEIAVAAHARVALPATTIGLPEVTLGLLPGAGGTQRVPRLVPFADAVAMVVSGKPVSAEKALAMGLIDRVCAGEVREVALSVAQLVINGTLKTRRTGELTVLFDAAVLATTRTQLEKARPRVVAPLRALDAVAAAELPMQAGLARERELFLEAMDHPERAALIHAFFAERAVNKIPEAAATPRPLDSAGVIGGGTMGSGIATALLLAGMPVVLIETAAERIDFARQTIEKNLAGAVKRGKISQQTLAAILAKLTLSTAFQALATVDLVVEAVFEDIAVKKAVFSQLDAVCKPEAILASNTSYLDINTIAAVTRRPASVLGLHFFSPAHVMRLVEVVVANQTAAEVVATGFALAKRLGKVAVRAGVCDGFIGNRILAHYRKAADYMLLDGAAFSQIDQALEHFGFAMGPFAVADLSGLDIGWATRKRKAATRPAEERYIAVADRICEAQAFGRKTGKGFYLYDTTPPVANPKVADYVASERAAKGITPRRFSDEDIVTRYMTAMVSECVRVLEDGIALRPVDIDAVFLFGYGFPRHRGGPMHYADVIGASELVRRIEHYAKEDAYYWQVPTLLREMAENGRCFSDLNKEH